MATIEIDDKLTHQYSPSKWSKRFSTGDQVIENHLKFCNDESNRARQLIPFKTESYGTGPKETIDIFGIDLPNTAPICVYIHGGFWQELTKKESAYLVQPLYNAGHRVIIVDYELCPIITLIELVKQITQAAKYIAQYASLNKSKHITYVGHSAGAHLAICLINSLIQTNEHKYLEKVRGLVLLAGIYDLNDIQRTVYNENNKLGLNNNVELLSPIKFDYSDDKWDEIIVQIFVGDMDSPQFIEQSTMLSKLFKNIFQLETVKFELLKNIDHFDLVEKLNSDTYQLTKTIISIV